VVAALAATVEAAGGVHVVPGFAGLGAPHWDPDARGRIEGLTFATRAPQLARAAVDSIAYQVADLVEAVDLDLASPLAELRIDGGASRNDDLVQLQADLLGRPVLRNASVDAAALGAAYLGGLTVGIWADETEIAELPRTFDRFEPRIDNDRRQELLAGWHAALDRASSKAEAWTR
jgi:glycerol kinase